MGYLTVIDIVVKPVPETNRWGIYYTYDNGIVRLYTTGFHRKSARTEAHKLGKKHGVIPKIYAKGVRV